MRGSGIEPTPKDTETRLGKERGRLVRTLDAGRLARLDGMGTACLILND